MLYSNIKAQGNRRASAGFRLEQVNRNASSDNKEKRQSRFIVNNPLYQISEIIANERNPINLRLPSTEAINNPPEKKIWGESLRETIELYIPFISGLFRFFLFYLVGILFYMSIEECNFTDCVYMITQTMTTVGYGNITPTTSGGRIFTMVYVYVGMLLVFSAVAQTLHWFVMLMRSKYKKPIKLNKLQVFVRNLINMGMWLIILFLIPMIGAIFFSFNEGWTFEEGMYFSIVTVTSTGYGDLQVTKDSSIYFNCVYMVIGVGCTALALDKISSFKRHLDEAELWQILDAIEPSRALIEAIHPNKPFAQGVSEAEFILHMLQLEGKLDYINDLTRWKEKFVEFDLDKDGIITLNDCHNYAKVVRRGVRIGNLPMRAQKKRSIVMEVATETRAVFLETIGRRNPHKRLATVDNKIVEQQQNLPSPKSRARRLKRASALDDDRGSTVDHVDIELGTISKQKDSSNNVNSSKTNMNNVSSNSFSTQDSKANRQSQRINDSMSNDEMESPRISQRFSARDILNRSSEIDNPSPIKELEVDPPSKIRSSRKVNRDSSRNLNPPTRPVSQSPRASSKVRRNYDVEL